MKGILIADAILSIMKNSTIISIYLFLIFGTGFPLYFTEENDQNYKIRNKLSAKSQLADFGINNRLLVFFNWIYQCFLLLYKR